MSKPSNSKQPRPEQISQDAPPPSYQASTSQPPAISHPAPTQPRHVHPQPFIHSRPSGNVVMYNYEGWTPPPNDQVARARARRRFFVALAWGFLIWVVLGLGNTVITVDFTLGQPGCRQAPIRVERRKGKRGWVGSGPGGSSSRTGTTTAFGQEFERVVGI